MKIVIVAGGTGGHVYPALTLAEALKTRGDEITFIGSTSRMEKDVIPQKGFDYIGLDVDIFAGGLSGKIKSLMTIYKEYKHCLKLLKGHDLAIGFGNYISVPVILAARKLKIKTVIHEQNSFAGKANRFLDTKVNLVIGSYEENKTQFKNPNTFIFGNPQSSKAIEVIKDYQVLKEMGLNPKKKTVLMFMGSLGSQTVNNVIVDYLNSHSEDYQVIYATGHQNYDDVSNRVKQTKNVKYFEVVDGAKTMKNCDLLVSRAGATTISEITAMGKAAILIPSPFVPNNHQYLNAKALVDKKAALMIEEKELTSIKLKEVIDGVINDDRRLISLGNNALRLSNPSVVENILEAIDRL